jgi:hypothetical protein
MLKTIGNVGADGINAASGLYGKMETIMKMAKMKDVLEKGGTEKEAFLEAQKWLFDYSLAPRTQKALRSQPIVGAPFSTFLYKAFPRVVEVMAKNPERMLPYAALPFMAESYAKQRNDWTEDDVDALKSMLNDHMKDKASVYLLPQKDAQGNAQFIDVGYIVPWGSYVEMARKAGSADMVGILKDLGIGGMPAPQLLQALTTGRDPFTGREILRNTDTPTEKVAAITKYIWDFSMPTFLSSHGAAGQLTNNLTHDEKDRLPNDRNLGQIASGLAGINVYPVNIDKGVEKLRGDIKRKQADLQKNYYSELNGARGDKEKQALKEEYTGKLQTMREDSVGPKTNLNKAAQLKNRENAKRNKEK